MATSRNSLMRMGLISGAAAAKVGVRGTKVQKSKMAAFDGKSRDEGDVMGNRGDALARSSHIEAPSSQADRAGSMPSTKKGNTGGGAVGSAARSKSTQGGRVGASSIPRRGAIDGFPGKQRVPFPAGTGTNRPPKNASDNTRMKGGPKPKSGFPYGGPSSRAAG
jgi:hypothetical protein